MNRMPVFCLLLFILAFPVSGRAGEIVWEGTAGRCDAKAEIFIKERVLTIRLSHPEGTFCTLTQDETQKLLNQVMEALPPGMVLQSIFLGRLVDYEWLSRGLTETASADPAWDVRKGIPKEGNRNDYVASVLSRRRFLDSIDSVLHRYGFTVRGVSVEKVLVLRGKERGRGVPSWVPVEKRVPFDALTHILVVPHETGGSKKSS